LIFSRLKNLGLSKHAEAGIPDLTDFQDPISLVGPEDWPFVLHEHEADVAGTHFDLRIGEPARDIVHSFAIPRGKLPAAGEKVLAIQGPVHSPESLILEGEIPEGYGKGVIRAKEKGVVEVLSSGPSKLRFNRYKGKDTDEYVLARTPRYGDKTWLLMNVTATPDVYPSATAGKPKYKQIKPDKVVGEDDTVVVQPKISGAHTFIVANKGRQIRQFSHRKSKRRKELIQHTYRVPEFVNFRPDFDAVVRSELFAVDKKGVALPESDVSALLNSSVPNARERASERGWRLQNMLLDVLSYKGKDVSSLPYENRRKLLEELSKKIPSSSIPIEAKTLEEKQRLLWAIQTGAYPLTREGVILWSVSDSGKPTKAKFREEEVVRIESIFPGAGGLSGKAAGGFVYRGPGGVRGRVGTGFTASQRIEMHERPREWIGRRAVISSFGRSARDSRKVPVFRYFHE
jgi:hypothetical protein